MTKVCVFQDWLFELTMQQQSVLALGCRGPDGIAKFHPTKVLVARYRATVLKAAYLGRAMRVDEGDDTTFMTMIDFSNDANWQRICKEFFEHVDSLPHHYYMHLMHGAQIAGSGISEILSLRLRVAYMPLLQGLQRIENRVNILTEIRAEPYAPKADRRERISVS